MPAKPPVIADGDSGFIGVNMRMDPALLSPGHVASARNKRFVNGKAATRAGVKKMPWSNKAHDAWISKNADGTAKSYLADKIVTYGGLAATINGTTEAEVNGGGGTVTLQYAAPPELNDGDFQDSASSFWNFDSEWSRVEVTTGVWVAEHASGDTAVNLWQDIDTLLGCKYTVTYTVSNWTQGDIQAYISESTANAGPLHAHPDGAGTGLTNTTSTFVDTIISKGLNPDKLYIQAKPNGSGNGFRGRVDNVSIVAESLPDKVDILGTFQQGGSLWKATGPSSNNSNESGLSNTDVIGPYFKSATGTGNTNKTPIQAYVPAIGGSLTSTAESTVNTAYWTNLGHRTYGYGTVYGAGIFRDPDSIEYLLVATAEGVYATKESSPSTLLAGGTISADVEFVQCFNVVVMFRGTDLEPQIMERIDEGFKAITKVASDTTIGENDSDGTVTIPNGSTGLFFSNRLLIPHDKDTVAASDYLNYTRYQPVLANFKINQGSEDELVSLVRINNSTVACFKTDSIYIVSNIYGNLSDITLDEVTREYGAVGKNSVVQVGSDVVFLSGKRGVTSLGIADNGKVTAVDVPLSDPIQPLIDRINWNYATEATAAYHNNRLYMAVPLDGALYNNAILVYDFLAKAWAGYDDGNAIKVKKFIETTYQGKRRLFFLDTEGFINLYDDALTECGFVDEVPNPSDVGKLLVEQVSDEVTTRGYTGSSLLSKRWASAEVQLATNDPTFTVTAVFDGASEDTKKLAEGVTFDRTKYDKPFHATDFNASMSGNDFFTQHRQDYSVDPDTEIALPTDGSDTGFDPDLHQQSQNRYKYRGEGKYVQLKVENTNGRAELLGVTVGGSGSSQSAVKQV